MASSAGNDDYEITGINVTPLVDVMLVLLIIFMVTATYVVRETIQIELPKAAAGGETTSRTLALVVTKDGKVYLDGAEVTDETLVRKIREAREKKEDMQAIISADHDATHGSVVSVLDMLRAQGITKFAIQIEKKQ
jgi:biopolymer transport protein ExbD